MKTIIGKQIINNKPIYITLRSIYGINTTTALKICAMTNINPQIRGKNISETEVDNINKYIRSQNMLLEEDLKKQVRDNIINLMKIGSYRGKRHSLRLPVHGQRTKSNSRTARKVKI